MGPAILTGSMALPIDLIDVGAVKRALTVSYLQMGEEAPLEIAAYTEDKTHLYVPRQFGLDFCHRNEIDFIDSTSVGHEVKFPVVPKPRDYQVEALSQVVDATSQYYDFLFRARTGWGKTIGSLIVAARLGVTTLILVDQENLKDQWIESLTKHFGFRVEDIGIIQGSKCSHEGKVVTIALVQTLSQRTYPKEVYDYFGLVIVDEVHIIGAPTFSQVLFGLSAAYRFGVSATPKRRDALQKLLTYHLGRVRVYIEDAHEPSAVYVAEHPGTFSEYANRSPKIGRFVTEVSDDAARNLLVAEAAAYLYDTGRDILVLGDRIEQLHELCSLCYYLGIPEDEMGVYAGYNLSMRIAKDPAPARRPRNLEKDAEYTPVKLQLISKKAKKADLERIKTTARIIFATYGKFSKGVDEPRLCGGVDATPRSQAEQEHGRILRKVDGKLTPIWITVADTGSYRSLFSLLSRLKGYAENSAVISKWSLERGKEKCDLKALKTDLAERVTHLKSLQIVTSKDGLSTPVTRQQQIAHALRPEAAITRRVVRRG